MPKTKNLTRLLLLPEVNFDGISGFTSNVGDIDSMSSNAIKILSNDETLQTFRENALKTAQQFDVKNIVPQYEKLYQKAINLM